MSFEDERDAEEAMEACQGIECAGSRCVDLAVGSAFCSLAPRELRLLFEFNIRRLNIEWAKGSGRYDPEKIRREA